MDAPVPLIFGVGGARGLSLAPLTGHDEAAAAGALALLGRLARAGDGLVHGAALHALTVGDRDRAIAALYRHLYGSDVRADAVCSICAARYEIRFDLDALQASRMPDGSAAGDPLVVQTGDTVLRLPTVADLGGMADDFLDRLTLEGPVPDEITAAALLEAADPALDLDLSGTCPECEAEQAVPFSIGRFLDAAMDRDRVFLLREMHLIASAYHWSRADILDLTRQDRQGLARLLIAEREAAAAPLRRVS